MSDVYQITEQHMNLARQAAASAYRSGRGIMQLDDLIGEALLWMAKHPHKLEKWDGEGEHGRNKTRISAKRACLKVIARERRKMFNLHAGDLYYYRVKLIEEILPDVFNRQDWFGRPSVVDHGPKGPSAPAEGNNRLAMLMDVLIAVERLDEADRRLLRELYDDGGVSPEVLCLTYGVSGKTLRKRRDRVLDQLVEALGGEPYWTVEE